MMLHLYILPVALVIFRFAESFFSIVLQLTAETEEDGHRYILPVRKDTMKLQDCCLSFMLM